MLVKNINAVVAERRRKKLLALEQYIMLWFIVFVGKIGLIFFGSCNSFWVVVVVEILVLLVVVVVVFEILWLVLLLSVVVVVVVVVL
jgi:hypothetical protein